MSSPEPGPVAERIGGGVSARLVAIGTLVVLAAVVWVGVSGKPSAPVLIADNDPSAAATDAPTLPTTPPSTATLPPTPDPAASATSGTPAPRRPPAPIDGFGVNGNIGDDYFHIDLAESEPGRLTGETWLTSPPADERLQVDLIQAWAATSDQRDVSLGTWKVRLAELGGDNRTDQEVLSASIPARPKLLTAPRPIQRGYELRVSLRLAFAVVVVIKVEVTLGPGRPLVGDDGIFGWPTTVNLPATEAD